MLNLYNITQKKKLIKKNKIRDSNNRSLKYVHKRFIYKNRTKTDAKKNSATNKIIFFLVIFDLQTGHSIPIS